MSTNRLADVMLRRNITIGQLHEKTQISERALYNYLDGKPISSAYLARLAACLRVDPSEIQSAPPTPRRLFGTGEPYPETRARQSARH